jgi:hypothetical protein
MAGGAVPDRRCWWPRKAKLSTPEGRPLVRNARWLFNLAMILGWAVEGLRGRCWRGKAKVRVMDLQFGQTRLVEDRGPAPRL